MSGFLLDTNICIYYFRQYPPVVHFLQQLYAEDTALIAATALTTGSVLVSNNDKDFKQVAEVFGLKYLNPVQDQEELRHYLNTQ